MTRFSPSWPHFSFSMGPVDPRVVTILVRTMRKLLRTNTLCNNFSTLATSFSMEPIFINKLLMGICPIQWRKVFLWYWLHWQETIQIDTGMVSKLLLLHLSRYNCLNVHADVGTVQNKTGIVQNWQEMVVHFYIGTLVQIWCCYIILLNQLFC